MVPAEQISTIASLAAAAAATIAAVFAGLSYLSAKEIQAAAIPFVIARQNNASEPNFIYFGLHGKDADCWKIRKLELLRPKESVFLEKCEYDDGYGGGEVRAASQLVA